MDLTSSMLGLLTIVLAVPVRLYHRETTYAALMALDEIPQVYKTDAAHLHTILEHHIFTLQSPLTTTQGKESTAMSIITSLTFIVVIFKIHFNMQLKKAEI